MVGVKILITGASGFVGGALWQRCRELGMDALGLGRRPIPGTDYLACDLSRPLKHSFRPDVVVHAAARSTPWGSQQDFHRQNVVATENLVAFCAGAGFPHIIYISTSAVLYREEHQVGMDEDTAIPGQFINEYARTKYRGEEIMRRYCGPSTILRPRAVFGPSDTVLFPRLLRAARRGTLPRIETDQPVLGDLIYIDSLVDYIVKVATGRHTGLFQLTNNQPVLIAEFLTDIFRRLGVAPPTRTIKAASALRLASVVETLWRLAPFLGEPPITRFGVGVMAYSKTFNVGKAIRVLGPPSVALEEGVARFIEWQKPKM